MSFESELGEPAVNAVDDAVQCLLALQRLGADDVAHRIARLRASHPGFLFELISEREAYDESSRYYLIVYDGKSNAVSLGYSGQSLPWPLRGTRKWSDADLVQVNGRTLEFRDAVAYMDNVWGDTEIAARLVNVALLREELARASEAVSDDELQHGLDALRRYHGLYDESATRTWMRERGLSLEQLEQLALDNIVYRKLRRRVAGRDVDTYFAECQSELDCVQVWTTSHPKEELARRLFEDTLRAPPERRLEVAIANIRNGARSARIELRTIRRRDLAMLSDASWLSEGTVLSPVRVKDVWLLNGVVEVRAARLDDETRDLIEELLFEQWLAERRRAAVVTWFWGTSDRASPGE